MLALAVPSIIQKTAFTCGPASLLSALKYLRVAGRASEESLAREMGTTSADGTAAEDMVTCARKRWPRVDMVSDLSYDGLRSNVARGNICILLLQAWGEESTAHVPYGESFRDGHYVVCVAAGPRTVYFADPSLPKCRARLTRRELLERWHELDNLVVLRQAAIILEGPDPRWRRLGRTKPMG